MTLSRWQRQVLSVLVALLALVLWWWTQHPDPGGTEGARGAGERSGQAAAPATPAPPSSSATPPFPIEPPGTDPVSGLPLVSASALPAEAATTLRLIDADGPFPHDRDGTTFFNRERLLPARDAGHYREYTVPTPGADDRGARRIVAGGAEEFYWTGDHYASFARISR